MGKEKNIHILVKEGTLKEIHRLQKEMQKKSPYRVTNDMVIRRLMEQSQC